MTGAVSDLQASPLVIGGTGGSGTRVVARIVRASGRFMGADTSDYDSQDALDLVVHTTMARHDGAGHIRSGAVIPRSPRPRARTRAVRSQSTSRLWRTSPSARRTGHDS